MDASSPADGPKCVLEPMNLHDQAQFDELLRQRIICGWTNTTACISSWRDWMDKRKRSFFWIKPASQPALRVGHVSLDCETDPLDLELANPYDKSVLTISSFFILQEHRRGGLGRSVVETLERLALEEPYGSPNCKAIAIHTLSRRYSEDDRERARYEELEGKPAPQRGLSNEDWYARMGYVKWKDQPRYPVSKESSPEKFVAVFMRKQIA
ncbi:unnamed protein product [Discula destructiva]